MDQTFSRARSIHSARNVYGIICRVYLIVVGLGTLALGLARYFSRLYPIPDVDVHLFCLVPVGAGSLFLLVDLACELILGRSPARYRHFYFFLIAFGWAVPLYFSDGYTLDSQLFWTANIWLLMAIALADAYERGKVENEP